MSDESNPFLIPGPPLPPKPDPEVVSRPRTDDEDGFITLPPGIVDSGTHRLAERPPREERAQDDIVFFAAPIGAPVPLGWKLHLPGDRGVDIAGTLFLGRDPVATPGHADAAALALDDPAKTLSKTHAMLERDGEELWVHDLNSTNGTVIALPDGSVTEVVPGRRVEVPAGAELELGDYVIRVDRG